MYSNNKTYIKGSSSVDGYATRKHHLSAPQCTRAPETFQLENGKCTSAPGTFQLENGKCTSAPGTFQLENDKCTSAPGTFQLENDKCTSAPETFQLENDKCTSAPGTFQLENGKCTRAPETFQLEKNNGLFLLAAEKKEETLFIIYNIMRRLNLSVRVQVSEISAIASRWDTLLLEKCSEKEIYLSNAISDFHNLTVRINETMNQMVTSGYEQLDKERRNRIRSLSLFLKSYRKEEEGETKDCAMLILDIFNHFGMRMLGKGVDGLTGMIDALIDDLSTPEAKNASAKVAHLDEKIEALKTANDRFKTERLAYQMRRKELSNSVKTKQLKLEIVAMINEVFIPYFSEKSKIEGGNFTMLYQSLAEIVAEANNLVKLRNARAKSKKKKKEENTSVANG